MSEAQKRGLDHIVWAVEDLDQAGASFEARGFTVTPQNDHAFGTSNRLIQLDRFFIELTAIRDRSVFPPEAPDTFSFPRCVEATLATGEGGAMFVLDCFDHAQTRADFLQAGIHVYAPFSFRRIANLPGGATAEVGFHLNFVRHADMPDTGFFTCEQTAPEHFWKPEFQRHENGMTGVEAVVFVAELTSQHSLFFQKFTGGAVRAVPGGIDVRTSRGRVIVLTPPAFKARFGHAAPGPHHLAGLVLHGGGAPVRSLANANAADAVAEVQHGLSLIRLTGPLAEDAEI